MIVNHVNCGDPFCESCFPPDNGKALWRGWATTALVMEMAKDMIDFLKKHSPEDCEYLKKYISLDNRNGVYCKNHLDRRATSVNTLVDPPEYYCEECWGARDAYL